MASLNVSDLSFLYLVSISIFLNTNNIVTEIQSSRPGSKVTHQRHLFESAHPVPVQGIGLVKLDPKVRHS